MLMFSDDNNGRLPRADHWVEDLTPRYVRSAEAFKCPDDKSGAKSSYAMNSALSGMPLSGIGNPASIVLIFETETPGTDPSGGPESVIKNPHHPGGAIYGFADGQAVASKAIPSFGSFKSNKSNNRYLLIGIPALVVIGIIVFLLRRKSPRS
jgi:prepilin-type processing-associated H-X9-DG protein